MARRPVGVDGQEGGHAVVDVGQVDAGIGAHESLLGLADDELVPPSEDAHRLAFDEAQPIGVVGHLRQPALGFGNDLLGDNHDVTVLERRASEDEIGDLVARAHLGQALDGEDRDHASRTTRASAAASATPRMTVGATTQRTPSASTAADRSASASSTTSVPASGA